MDIQERRQILDDEHLRLLRIGYFVVGCVSALYSLIGVFYAGMGALMGGVMHAALKHSDKPSPALMMGVFAVLGIGVFALFGTHALLSFLTARNLRLRRSRTLCFVTAAFSCLYIPFGTLIGIYTFSVLGRPRVVALFDRTSPADPWAASGSPSPAGDREA